LQGQIPASFAHSPYLLSDESPDKNARELWWMNQEFSSVIIIIIIIIIPPRFSILIYNLGMKSRSFGDRSSET
jgi:hypothetical protein